MSTTQATPDVTVIVAVYNTLPYLTACLASLTGQTIGGDRMEIIAVDDGSTDGSGAELDRWQQRYPETIRVIHQANSGGPAAPSNRALDEARGRYVFFIGADDHLGSEALARLVTAADDLDADIVLGRLVGDGGRAVSQAIYDPGDRDDITLVNSALPMALSNTKLFRRSLIEEHRIRYPEDLRSLSDQPFTIKAIVHARRIAVRSDYKFYFAVRRSDASNITYGTSLQRQLDDTAALIDHTADLFIDPADRARVLRRHFLWEVPKIVGRQFAAAEPAEQERVQDGIRKLAEAYLTDDVRHSLDVHKRLLVSVAQFGTPDALRALVAHHLASPLEPVVVEGDRHYLAYPGFRDPALGFPDSWFDGTGTLAPRTHQAGAAAVRSAGGTFTVRWESALTDLLDPAEPPGRVFAGAEVAASTVISPAGEVTATFDVPALIAGLTGRKSRQVRFARTVRGEFSSLPVTAGDKRRILTRILHRSGLRLWSAQAETHRDGRLRIVVEPLTFRRFVKAVLRRLRLR